VEKSGEVDDVELWKRGLTKMILPTAIHSDFWLKSTYSNKLVMFLKVVEVEGETNFLSLRVPFPFRNLTSGFLITCLAYILASWISDCFNFSSTSSQAVALPLESRPPSPPHLNSTTALANQPTTLNQDGTKEGCIFCGVTTTSPDFNVVHEVRFSPVHSFVRSFA